MLWSPLVGFPWWSSACSWFPTACIALTTPRMRFLTKQQFLYNQRVNGLLVESTKSIRDVHLHGSEQFFISRFHDIGSEGKRYDRLLKILPDLPRFVIEPAGVTVLFVVGLLPPLIGGGLDEVRNALPALVGVVFASLRLAAPLQAVFRAVNKLRASLPDLDNALALLRLDRTHGGSCVASGDARRDHAPSGDQAGERRLSLQRRRTGFSRCESHVPVGAALPWWGHRVVARPRRLTCCWGCCTVARSAAARWCALTGQRSRPGRNAALSCPRASNCWMPACAATWPLVSKMTPSMKTFSGSVSRWPSC